MAEVKYQLVPDTHPILRKPTVPFVFDGTVDPDQLAADLITTMEEHRGIGLAANQVGLPYSMFVLAGDPYAVFNPKIVDVSEEKILLEEGCLTYPGLYVKVKRPKSIRIRFQTIKGEYETHKFTGMTARIIQHEMEHLDGGVYYLTASLFHREQAMKRWKHFKRHPDQYEKRQVIRSQDTTVPKLPTNIVDND